MESSFRGHKASPGNYSITLKKGDQVITKNFQILANPLYPTDAKTYQEYHMTMSNMEAEVSKMHHMVNMLDGKRKQLKHILETLPEGEKYTSIKKEGAALVQRMKEWDEDMVQRKSKAYDDVENFPNKFTANYMFLINQTESDIPRVNKSSLDRMKELNAQWSALEARAREMLDKDIPSFNKQLWSAGVGAIWVN
jgi:superfamily II DNA helicase RecQ